jgi:hypothetical protein
MRHLKTLLALGVMAAAGLVPVIFATAAYANVVSISINCSSVTFTYTDIPSGGGTANEAVAVNGTTQVSKTNVAISDGFTDTVSFSASNGDTVSASSTFGTSDGTFSNSASQTLSGCAGAPCPQGKKINFRWHYSANGSSGSWSGTKTVVCPGSLTMGPQAMEGDLKVSPGTTLKAGYDFTLPGNNSSLSLSVNSPQVVFAVNCVSGATPSSPTFTVSMPTTTYSVTNSQWYPSGDQSSPLVYEGSVTVPDLCGGGQLRLNQGGTFTASVS